MTVLDLRGLPSAVFGSAVSARATYEAEDAAIRTPLATARRVGVVALAPTTATTAVALAVARVVASRRSDPVLVVDPGGGREGVAAALGQAPTPPDPRRAGARTTADARSGLTTTDGITVLRPIPRPADGDAVGRWLAEAAPIARFFDVSITDFGVRHPLRDLAACAALSDVVCLVGSADRGSAEELRAVAPAVAALPEAPAPVIVLVDRGGRGPQVADVLADDGAWPVVRVPSDPALDAGALPRRLSTTRALLRLAAVLVAGGREPRP